MTQQTQSNGFDPERLRKVVGTIEGKFEELASEQGAYMARCRRIRESIANVYEEAKAHGIPKGELKSVIKTRGLQRKLDAIREELEGDAQETYDQIRHALGDLADLPLGKAALGGGEDEQDGDFDEEDQTAANNAALLRRGIKKGGLGANADAPGDMPN